MRVQRRSLFVFHGCRIRKIVIAGVPPLIGATDLEHVLVSTSLLLLELTDTCRAERRVNLRVPRIVLCVNFVVHGWRSSTCAVAGFREIVIAKVPPLMDTTVSRLVVVTRVKLRTPWCVLWVNVVLQIELPVHRKLAKVTTESGGPPQLMAPHRKIRLLRRRRCCWARERLPQWSEGPRRSSQASGRASGGRREDCVDLGSGSAAHEHCDSMESLDMVALVHFVIKLRSARRYGHH